MGCEGSEIEYKDIMPAELQALRKKIASYTSGKMGQTATALPEGFPLSAQVNPLQTNAANIMNMLMGGGTMGQSGYNTSPGGYGGGAASGGGSISGSLSGNVRPAPGNPRTRDPGTPITTVNPDMLQEPFRAELTRRWRPLLGEILAPYGFPARGSISESQWKLPKP